MTRKKQTLNHKRLVLSKLSNLASKNSQIPSPSRSTFLPLFLGRADLYVNPAHARLLPPSSTYWMKLTSLVNLISYFVRINKFLLNEDECFVERSTGDKKVGFGSQDLNSRTDSDNTWVGQLGELPKQL